MMKTERPLGDYLAPLISEAQTERRWSAIAARRRRRTTVLRAARYALPLGAAAALLIAIASWSLRRPAAAIPEAGLVVTTGKEAQKLQLADGSSVDLDADTRIALGGSTLGRRRLEVEHGTVHLAVKGSSARRFSVRAGDVEVIDIGTVFSVAHDKASSMVRVSVTEGEVDVTSAGGPTRTLLAGESLTTLDRAVAAPRASASEAPSSAVAVAEPPAAPPPAAEAPALDVTAPPATTAKAPDPVTARSLFADATAARESGNAALEAQALDSLRKRFPSDGRAPLATFELGRIRMDRLGDRAGALEAFRSAVAIAPGASFREDAEARMIELLDRMGRSSECQSLRSAFLARHPSSIHKAAIATRCPSP